MPTGDVLSELQWRGLVHQTTGEAELRQHLAAPRRVYAGFDPTADSLTIGNLVPIMLLAHFKKAGHEPVVVMGGGTGLIGDPSGKSAERQLMTAERVAEHVEKQRPIFESVLGKVDGPAHTIVNNADWLGGIGYLEMLRDVGKHFSVNMMIQKESVKARLENREQGISYTEFSYMILQAYDFLRLYEDRGVTVQIGGSDQFGNIIAGLDLIRRYRSGAFASAFYMMQEYLDHLHIPTPGGTSAADFSGLMKSIDSALASGADLQEEAEQLAGRMEWLATQAPEEAERLRGLGAYIRKHALKAFGLTAPLVQKADGGKFGKTESGAVWLTAERTSPYAYHQFWLNASDADALNFLRTFTFLDKPTIDGLAESMRDNPAAREAQKRLADEATTILHGEDECRRAKAAGAALFSGDVSSLDERTLREVLADVPSSDHDRAALGQGVDPVALLTATGLAKSNREAREFLSGGSVAVNGRKIGPDDRLTGADLLHGSLMALRRGKKTWHLARWS